MTPSRREFLGACAAVVLAGGGPRPGSDPDGEYTAVVDRFEVDADDRRLAVLVLERDGETVGDLVVPATALPADARRRDAVLSVRVVDGDLVDAAFRPGATRRRRAAARSRFESLSGKSCGLRRRGKGPSPPRSS